MPQALLLCQELQVQVQALPRAALVPVLVLPEAQVVS